MYVSGAPEKYFYWVGAGLTNKHKTRLERLARDKHILCPLKKKKIK
jgi:hypothetical protein